MASAPFIHQCVHRVIRPCAVAPFLMVIPCVWLQVAFHWLSDREADSSGIDSGTHKPESGTRCWGRQQGSASGVYHGRWGLAFQVRLPLLAAAACCKMLLPACCCLLAACLLLPSAACYCCLLLLAAAAAKKKHEH